MPKQDNLEPQPSLAESILDGIAGAAVPLITLATWVWIGWMYLSR